MIDIALEEKPHMVTGVRLVIFRFFRSNKYDLRILFLHDFGNPRSHDADHFALMLFLEAFDIAEPADGVAATVKKQLLVVLDRGGGHGDNDGIDTAPACLNTFRKNRTHPSIASEARPRACYNMPERVRQAV